MVPVFIEIIWQGEGGLQNLTSFQGVSLGILEPTAAAFCVILGDRAFAHSCIFTSLPSLWGHWGQQAVAGPDGTGAFLGGLRHAGVPHASLHSIDNCPVREAQGQAARSSISLILLVLHCHESIPHQAVAQVTLVLVHLMERHTGPCTVDSRPVGCPVPCACHVILASLKPVCTEAAAEGCGLNGIWGMGEGPQHGIWGASEETSHALQEVFTTRAKRSTPIPRLIAHHGSWVA